MANKNNTHVFNKEETKKLIRSLMIEEQAKIDKMQNKPLTIDNIFEHFDEATIRRATREVIKENEEKAALNQSKLSGLTHQKKAQKNHKLLGAKTGGANSFGNTSWLKGKPAKKEVKIDSNATGKTNNVMPTDDHANEATTEFKYLGKKKTNNMTEKAQLHQGRVANMEKKSKVNVKVK